MPETLTKREIIAFRIERDCMRVNGNEEGDILESIREHLGLSAPGEAALLLREMRSKVGRIIERGYAEGVASG